PDEANPHTKRRLAAIVDVLLIGGDYPPSEVKAGMEEVVDVHCCLPTVGSISRYTIVPTMADVVQVVPADDPVRPLFSPAGELTAEAKSRLGLDAAGLRDLYRQMVMIRRAD